MFVFVCFFGCAAPELKTPELNPAADFKSSTLETSLEADVDELDIPYGGNPEQPLLAEAESKGMKTIFEDWLNRGFLFQLNDCPKARHSEYTFIQAEGQFSADLDKITGNYSQSFTVRANFRACRHLSGEILRLDEGKTMTAPYKHIIIRLNGVIPEEQEPYFLIARQEEVRGLPILRLIGGGKVKDFLGQLASGEILRVRKEIKVGDTIFLVQVRIQPLTAPETPSEIPEETFTPEVDEVMVQPKMEPEKRALPAEPK